jgi:hypothetical protein
MTMTIEQVLAQLAAGTTPAESEKTAATAVAVAAKAEADKKAEAEKTAAEAAAKTSEAPKFSPEAMKVAEALTANPEALKALMDMSEQEEKTAEAEKLAEELEFQGRLFARGLVAEQTKIAYLADQIDEAAVEKTAAALGMTLDELMGEKIADAQDAAYTEAKNNSGAGKRDVALNATHAGGPATTELKGMSAVANALKKVRTNKTDLPTNG